MVDPKELDDEGFKPLREQMASGTIEGEEYIITQDLGSGAIIVEFDEVSYSFYLNEMLQEAYHEKENGD